MNSQCYKVKDWHKHFENAESRKYKSLKWIPVPNKHDGKIFGRLRRFPEFPELFAGWILILQVASKCPVRGILADEEGPLTARDLSDKTGCDEKLFANALSVLSSKEIGWLEIDSISCNLRKSPEHLPEPTEKPSLNRIEQNRTEVVGGQAAATINLESCVKKLKSLDPSWGKISEFQWSNALVGYSIAVINQSITDFEQEICNRVEPISNPVRYFGGFLKKCREKSEKNQNSTRELTHEQMMKEITKGERLES